MSSPQRIAQGCRVVYSNATNSADALARAGMTVEARQRIAAAQQYLVSQRHAAKYGDGPQRKAAYSAFDQRFAPQPGRRTMLNVERDRTVAEIDQMLAGLNRLLDRTNGVQPTVVLPPSPITNLWRGLFSPALSLVGVRLVTGTVTPQPAGQWTIDPSEQHELRWWDGAQWTEHVVDAGVQSKDPIRPGK